MSGDEGMLSGDGESISGEAPPDCPCWRSPRSPCSFAMMVLSHCLSGDCMINSSSLRVVGVAILLVVHCSFLHDTTVLLLSYCLSGLDFVSLFHTSSFPHFHLFAFSHIFQRSSNHFHVFAFHIRTGWGYHFDSAAISLIILARGANV